MSRYGRAIRLLAFLVLDALPAVAADDTLEFSSGPDRVALVELYTSEGCSSCPPADRWLSELSGDARLWKEFVPVAFHVDYWDYIGWRDRFATAAYSSRQRRYIEEGVARVVYTPGMFLAGREWLDWRRGDRPAPVATAAGTLAVMVEGNSVAVQFAPAMPPADGLSVNIAVLGMGLDSEVTRGENRGRRLSHDFVVLHHETLPMTSAGAGFKAVTTLRSEPDEADKHALAVWVSSSTSLEPLQATGGMLD